MSSAAARFHSDESEKRDEETRRWGHFLTHPSCLKNSRSWQGKLIGPLLKQSRSRLAADKARQRGL